LGEEEKGCGMKTTAMRHQTEALRRMEEHEKWSMKVHGEAFFALHMEMGTGKTYVFLAHAEKLYKAGKVDGLLVIAPKGVHTNWVLREIPQHMSVPYIARSWRSGAGKAERLRTAEVIEQTKKEKAAAKELLKKTGKLRILSMNIDAICTKDGFEIAKKFCQTFKVMIVMDESTRIKNEGTERFKAAAALGRYVSRRYEGTGMPVTNKPHDLYGQFEWLLPEGALLGTTSYRAFVAEYSVLLDKTDWAFKKMIEKNPRVAYAQIVKKDDVTGKPIYRNLDKLNKLVAPHSYRVLKKECLDLPDKMFKQVYFDLTPKQRAAYKTMEDDFRYQFEDGTIEAVAKLNAIPKLQQITSGFLLLKDGSTVYVEQDNPRLKALKELLIDFEDRKVIIWAWFKEEIRAIARLCEEMGRAPVQYHGGVKDKEREAAIDGFQKGKADTFIGNQASGGIGLTLTAASETIYYSNNFNLEHRAQSEDRNHRVGQKNSVTYYDIIAEDTVDDTISLALQKKTDLAAEVLKDSSCLFRRGRASFSSEKGNE
jgi:SNF2 family DNA or RNA helicase